MKNKKLAIAIGTFLIDGFWAYSFGVRPISRTIGMVTLTAISVALLSQYIYEKRITIDGH